MTTSFTWPFDSSHAISYWWSIGTEHLSPAVFGLLGSKRIGVKTLTVQGHMTSSVTKPFHLQVVIISYRCAVATKSISSRYRDNGLKIYGGLCPLTFIGNMMSSVTWPFNSAYPISCWWSTGTKHLSPAAFEILGSKHIGVTTLTFQGHVTSLVTWPFDLPLAISYWWSFGTKPLSLSQFTEISRRFKC